MMVMFLFHPTNLLFMFGQNWVSNRLKIAFDVVVVVVVHVVVAIVVFDPINLLLKFG